MRQLDASLWLDELNTAWVVDGSLAELGPRARVGNQTRVYFWLPWVAVRLLGLSEFALRLPSLLAGVALIPSAAWIVWRWSGSLAAASVVALLVALDHHCVFYAQEARVYALLQLAALWHVFAVWNYAAALAGAPASAHGAGDSPQGRIASGQGGRGPNALARIVWRVAFVAGGAAMFSLHYTVALLVVAELVWLATVGLESLGRSRLRLLALDLTVLCVLCLPAVSQLIEIGGRRANWRQFISQQPLVALADWFSLGGCVVLPLVMWGAVAAVRRCTRARRLKGDEPPERTTPAAVMMLLVCWFLVPALIAWLLTVTDVARLFWPRYLMFVAVAPMLFAGVCVSRLPTRVWRGAAAVLIVSVAVAQQSGWRTSWREIVPRVTRDQDWRAAAARIAEHDPHDQRPVFVRSGLIEGDALRGRHAQLLEDLCRSPLLTLYSFKRADQRVVALPSTDAGRLDAANLRRLRAASGGWFVVNGRENLQAAFEQDLRASLADTPVSLTRHTLPGTVEVWETRILD